MKKIEELRKLEKNPDVNLSYVEFFADVRNEEQNTRTRILHDKAENRYYYHRMKDGNITECFEIAFSWKPFPTVTIFCYTPDGLHPVDIDVRENGITKSYHKIWEDDIPLGHCATIKGNTIVFENENTLTVNGRRVPVEYKSEYAIKCLKTKMQASGGARRLYAWLESIAFEREQKPDCYPVFYDVFMSVCKKYA